MARGPWTHAICDECWAAIKSTVFGTDPYRIADPTEEKCCYCERRTKSGIYVRDDPRATKCGGRHEN